MIKYLVPLTWEDYMQIAKAIGLLSAKIEFLEQKDRYGDADLSIETYKEIKKTLEMISKSATGINSL